MSTIRPLATIAILAVVGVFLAQEINKSPAGKEGASADWEGSSLDPAAGFQANTAADPLADAGVATGVPPIGADETPSPAATLPAPMAAPPLAVDPPDLPPLAPAGGSDSPLEEDPFSDLPLPNDIPTANYDAPSDPPAAPAFPPPAAPQIDTPGVAGAPPSPAAPPGTTPLTAPTAPVVASLPPAPSPGSGYPSPVASAPQTIGTYATARPAIEGALGRNELSQALLLLSAWRGDPTLSADESSKVDTLLGQLAGSVIYSNQHLLEGPYTVRPGDTLATIAQRHSVPWELLAKINGIGSPTAVLPGQVLKVVRGPFRATVDLSDGELSLSLDGRYAGRFPATPAGAAAVEGRWRIDRKEQASGKQLMLVGSAGPSYGKQIVIDAGASSSAASQGRIAVADRDLGDLFDILSVGSEVTVRR